MLLYIIVPQNTDCSSSVPVPCKIKPIITEITPIAISAIAQVFIFAGISNCSFIDTIVKSLSLKINFYGFAAVESFAGAAVAAAVLVAVFFCFDRI